MRLSIELPEPPVRQRPKAESLPIPGRVPGRSTSSSSTSRRDKWRTPRTKNATGTLLNGLLAYAGGGWTPSLVNRLDKDTSGLVLVAKSAAIQTALQRAMNNNDVEKDYLAVVRGKPVPARGTIDLALDRDPWDRRRVMVRDRGGQPSVTKYERLTTSADGTLSTVRCRLITGRTHQIRVHLAAKGWPIVGDSTYGVKDVRIARQALHAWRLAFSHPRTGQRLTFTAPIPSDIRTRTRP